MGKLRLTLACREYDRTRALADGVVQPEGIELNFVDLNVNEIFWRMLRHAEFDVAEISTAGYLMTRDLGKPALIAIPVFTSRAFRHNALFINTNSGIQKPQDLMGKRVGVHDYTMTAAVWVRGILQHDYGVLPHTIQWFTGGQEEPTGGKGRFEIRLPDNVQMRTIPIGKTLSSMLESGEIDALLSPSKPSSFIQGTGKVRRLFPDYRKVEMDYYRQTKIFPIMHTVALREEVYQQHRWVAQSLFKAFARAKEECYAHMEEGTLRYSLPWLFAEVEEEREFFGGGDPWAYGLEPNRVALETLIGYAFEQGLIRQKMPVESLFTWETLDQLGG